jgi:hypothetical protein
MDVMGFLCVSLGSSTVQLHDSLGGRHACGCSEDDFGSQNGDCLRSILLKSSALLCFLSVGKRTQCKGYS